MSEWWTYTLSDFLLFSPRTYYRLFELHHRAHWPLQLAALAAGALMLAAAMRGGRTSGRAAVAIAAAAWLWVGWSWHVERYATINWAAGWIGAGFAAQSLLLFATGVATTRLGFASAVALRRRLGVGIVLFALALQPVTGLLAGRSWTEAEVFGITPGPTAAATLGLLLLAERTRWELALIPLLGCLLDGATLWALDAADAWIPPALAVVAVGGLAATRGPARVAPATPQR